MEEELITKNLLTLINFHMRFVRELKTGKEKNK